MEGKSSSGGRRLVIVGGGFGGLYTARSLARADLDITLVDRTNHHLFQPLLYQVATAALSESEIATPLRSILSAQENATVLMADVRRVDLDRRTVWLARGESLPYDILVLAPGNRPSYFGHDEWPPCAPGLKTLDDAAALRDKILLGFERAEAAPTPEAAARDMTFVIVGGGPTGVELAGAIAEIAKQTMLRNFRRIDPTQTRIHLIEGGPRLLAGFPEKLSARAARDLASLGVSIETDQHVTDIDDEGVHIGDRLIATSNVIWAAGNTASPLLRTLGCPLDRQGRVFVEPDLSVPGHPEVFVIGDAAHAMDSGGNPLPGVAPVAIQEGRHVARIIAGGPRSPFRYRDRGALATIGKNRAVAHVAGLSFAGYIAWILWSIVHLMNIIVFANRFLVLIRWVRNYITGQRGVRIISAPNLDPSPCRDKDGPPPTTNLHP